MDGGTEKAAPHRAVRYDPVGTPPRDAYGSRTRDLQIDVVSLIFDGLALCPLS